MRLTTSYADFAADRVTQKIVPVCRELFADADTPVSIYRKLTGGRSGTFLLESAAQGIFDRYSFVGVQSFGVLTERQGKAHWEPNLALPNPVDENRLLPGGVSHLDPVAAVAAVYNHWEGSTHPELPPLVSGFVGYLGWESVVEFENIQPQSDDEPLVPRQYLGFVADLAVIDHREGTVTLVANVLTDNDLSEAEAESQWQLAQQRLDVMQEALREAAATPVGVIDKEIVAEAVRRTSQEEFFAGVARTKQHIIDGDAFQVVLSQRFELENHADPLDVYRVLRHLNPSPYLYLLSASDASGAPFAVVGSSPEALITVQGEQVLTHPIAGSRPRGANPDEDAALAAELLADQKERSEHLMLVDLSRNDLSRVCEPGSVAVTEFMEIERFSHVTHISSTVEGKLRADCSPVDALVATFPAGTLSGAPKPWALRIINDLEPVRRGVYGGVVGYFGLGGNADLAIAIRTATLKGDTAYVQAGAGLVADSDPVSEDAECRNKAAAPLRAVAIANTLRAA
ncbi:chorismate-binding protein [Canibacter zhoujuaniae]|uniref:chorismate-binding protein n=1 Tax=Canibacter zhoujuaniae TaxID=2708343 RepID=UPI00141F67C1|nr:chorismate-binding protein [Canibacter zhoujuaniae]